MSFNQPADWNERATVRKTEGHQIRLGYGPNQNGIVVSCICMPKHSKFSGDTDSGYEPIAEISPSQDPFVPYDAYHRMKEVPVEEYRPAPRAVCGQVGYQP